MGVLTVDNRYWHCIVCLEEPLAKRQRLTKVRNCKGLKINRETRTWQTIRISRIAAIRQ